MEFKKEMKKSEMHRAINCVLSNSNLFIMKRAFIALFCILTLSSSLTFGQLNREQMRTAAVTEMRTSLIEFRQYLSIPNNGKVAGDIDANVLWTEEALKDRGFKTKILTEGGVKHVFAEGKQDPKKKTVLVYFQVDGQPVDSSQWNQESPYIPELMEEIDGNWETLSWNFLDGEINPDWRIFARSASDSKGPSMTFLSALDILKRESITPSVNLKLILDFQEEISSPQLAKLVEKNKDLFEADGILIMDGTRHISNLPTLAFGARGISTISLRIFGAEKDLHSGQYGNFAPNPVFKAAKLLAAMKDENGKVLIPGFYEGVTFTEEDLRVMAAVPESNEEIERELGFAKMDLVGDSYQEAMQYPSLNIRGIRAAWVGEEVRTIIPSEVVVEIDMRTVAETPNERQVELVRQFIEDQGYHLIEGDPSVDERQKYPKLASFNYRLGSQPFRADLNSKFADWLSEGMQAAFDDDFVRMRLTGGSQPMAPFINILGIPAVSVRIPNPDNNIHAPNENIRLGNYLEGIQTCLALLTQPFE